MRKWVSVLTLLYPAVIFFLRDSPYFFPVALALGMLLIFELISRLEGKWRLMAFGALIVLWETLSYGNPDNTVRIYPFAMSLSMLLLFALAQDPHKNPMIGPLRSKVAREPKILQAMHEARWIWIGGLTLNTLVLGSMLFLFSQDVWILYASFYSYILLVALFVISVLYVHVRSRRMP